MRSSACRRCGGYGGHDDPELILLGIRQTDLTQFRKEHAAEFQLSGRTRVRRRTFDCLGMDANVPAETIE